MLGDQEDARMRAEREFDISSVLQNIIADKRGDLLAGNAEQGADGIGSKNIINVIDKNNLIKNANNIIFTFKTTAGIQNVINTNQNKNMSDLIKSYFD